MNRTRLSGYLFKETDQVVGMFFFHRQNTLQHATRRRVVVTYVVDHLAITINSDTFGDQIFFDHVDERVAFDIFRMASQC